MRPAIVAVGYNRPHCMKRLLESIGNAWYPDNGITLIVSIDESNKSDEVQKIAVDFEWRYGEKIIRRYPKRQGLRNHIIQCGDLSEKYGTVIILEDDLYVSPAYYSYVEQAHERYDGDERIAGVSLYTYGINVFSHDRFIPSKNSFDTYFGQYIITWGESWSFKQWKHYKTWLLTHEDKLPTINDHMPTEILGWTRSWGKYHISYMVENNLYYVMPYTALSTNFSERGEHKEESGYDTAYQVQLLSKPMNYRFAPFEQGVKYDSFFERMFENEIAPGLQGADVCVDLYGTRVSCLGKKYLLTCKKYNLPLVRTFGLRMRPIEDNITYNIEGNGIYLYYLDRQIELISRNKKRDYQYQHSVERIRYESYDMNYRQLTPYVLTLYKEAFVRKGNTMFDILTKKR